MIGGMSMAMNVLRGSSPRWSVYLIPAASELWWLWKFHHSEISWESRRGSHTENRIAGSYHILAASRRTLEVNQPLDGVRMKVPRALKTSADEE